MNDKQILEDIIKAMSYDALLATITIILYTKIKRA